MQKSKGERVFSVFNGIFLLFIICTVVFPLAHILSISLSEKQAIINQTVGLLPKGIRFDAYKYIFLKPAFLTSLANTVGLTAAYVFTFWFALWQHMRFQKISMENGWLPIFLLLLCTFQGV